MPESPTYADLRKRFPVAEQATLFGDKAYDSKPHYGCNMEMPGLPLQVLDAKAEEDLRREINGLALVQQVEPKHLAEFSRKMRAQLLSARQSK